MRTQMVLNHLVPAYGRGLRPLKHWERDHVFYTDIWIRDIWVRDVKNCGLSACFLGDNPIIDLGTVLRSLYDVVKSCRSVNFH